jgi:hypothetical protein
VTNKLSLAYALSQGWLSPGWPGTYIEEHRRVDARLNALTDAQLDVYVKMRESHGIRESLTIAEAS